MTHEVEEAFAGANTQPGEMQAHTAKRITTFSQTSLSSAIDAIGALTRSAANAARRQFGWSMRKPSVLFIGYAEGDLGLGQTFRNNIVAATRTGLPVAIYPFQRGVETRLIAPFMPELYDQTHTHDINCIEVAADQAPVVFNHVDRRLTEQSYNILRTFWELPLAPEAWRPMLQWIDELWLPNEFVANAFKPIFPGKIAIIPPAVDTGQGQFDGREAFGMEQGRFYFFFSFDYFSSPYRKNPTAVLEAFQKCFRDRSERVGLVIKSIGAPEHFPDLKNVFLKAAADDPRIVIIDKSLPRRAMLSLIRACDAYVSLHRSEGFGAGMAEAMSFGRAVIGTNFSGNTEFLTSATGFPVRYTLRPVKEHEYSWSAQQLWAEPDVSDAAALMRLVFERPALAAERAKAGKALIEAKYSLDTVGQAIKRRIEQIDLALKSNRRRKRPGIWPFDR